MAWVLLFVAGVMEIGWAIGLKFTEGFTKLVPTALTLGAMRLACIALIVAGIAGLKLAG